MYNVKKYKKSRIQYWIMHARIQYIMYALINVSLAESKFFTKLWKEFYHEISLTRHNTVLCSIKSSLAAVKRRRIQFVLRMQVVCSK